MHFLLFSLVLLSSFSFAESRIDFYDGMSEFNHKESLALEIDRSKVSHKAQIIFLKDDYILDANNKDLAFDEVLSVDNIRTLLDSRVENDSTLFDEYNYKVNKDLNFLYSINFDLHIKVEDKINGYNLIIEMDQYTNVFEYSKTTLEINFMEGKAMVQVKSFLAVKNMFKSVYNQTKSKEVSNVNIGLKDMMKEYIEGAY